MPRARSFSDGLVKKEPRKWTFMSSKTMLDSPRSTKLTEVFSKGRVYFLHFESYEDKTFFWMQDPKEGNDEKFAKELNRLINLSEDQIQRKCLSQFKTADRNSKPQKCSPPRTQTEWSRNGYPLRLWTLNPPKFSASSAAAWARTPFQESPKTVDVLLRGPTLNKILKRDFLRSLSAEQKQKLVEYFYQPPAWKPKGRLPCRCQHSLGTVRPSPQCSRRRHLFARVCECIPLLRYLRRGGLSNCDRP